MIFRVLIKPFGSIWKLKELCNTEHPTFLTKVYRFLYNAYQFEHGSAISYKASFTEIPNLPYGTKQIIISDDAKIGKNCVIFQQVTIQRDTLPDSPSLGSPVIGDNCYIFPGAKIIGGIIIGDNVRIAPNATVIQDVPDNSYISNGDQKVITMKELNNRYYIFSNNRWIYFNNNISIPVENKEILEKLQEKFQH